MKLVIAIVHDDDEQILLTDLNKQGFSVTKLATTGGFLRSGNTTLLIGTETEKTDQVLAIIKSKCGKRKKMLVTPPPISGMNGAFAPFPIEADVGGATIFVVDVEHFEKA